MVVVIGSLNMKVVCLAMAIVLVFNPLTGHWSAYSAERVEKVGRTNCQKGKNGYIAVLKVGKRNTSIKSILKKLAKVSDKKLIKKYKNHISVCTTHSAPKSSNQNFEVVTNSSTITIPFESAFPGVVMVAFSNIPSGVSVIGTDPGAVIVELPDGLLEATFSFSLTRGKTTSPNYSIVVRRNPTPPLSPSITPLPGGTALPPVALAAAYNVIEINSVAIKLQVQSAEKAPIFFSIIGQPTLGTLSGSGSDFTYTARHQRGSDSFTFVATQGNLTSVPATVQINVDSGIATFAGSRTSLEPYRENITEAEAVHLCNKISFGCPYPVIQYGVANGLSKFVDYLFTYQPSTNVELAVASGTFAPGADGLWTTGELRQWWVPYLVRGNGVKERMSLFWHDHFAVDLDSVESTFGNRQAQRQNWIIQHLDLIRQQSLSSFSVLYEGMHTDPVMVEWLDNNNNYYNNGSRKLFPNENYSREILELFSMGTVDFFTGLPNYDTDADVKELTRAFTGINFQNGTSDTTSFFTSRWDPFDKTLFAGLTSQSNGKFNYVSATDTILYSHPGTRRNIAGKLVRVLVMPNPSEVVVDKLGTQLLDEKYNISVILKKIAKSSMMFSNDARFGCITSPSEQLLRLLRVLNVPITSKNTVDSILGYFNNTGQILLRPETVFGWKGCGVGERGVQIARGENWIGATWTLERQRQLTSLLETIRVREYNSEPIGTSSYLDALLPSATATPKEIILRISLLLGIQLSQGEADYIEAEYLNKDRNSTSGARTTVTWTSRSVSSQRQKLAGLVVILMQHPKAMTY
jgi:hypothetical protein